MDGLRPDYITPEWMPNLHALGQRGAVGERHSAVYPTYTRVNSAAIATGSYPGTHGLVHNTMYDVRMGASAFSTGTARTLMRYRDLIEGPLLTAPTLGELLEQSGLRFFVAGSCGRGTAFLQNPTGAGLGVWQAQGFFHPASAREAAQAALGGLPGDHRGAEGTRWAFDGYLHYAGSDTPPAVAVLWLTAPDAAGHAHGVGAGETLQAVTDVDRNIGRLLEAHESMGLTDAVNVFITSDHGFSTTTGGLNLSRILQGAGLPEYGLRIVQNMIWIETDDPIIASRAIEALHRHEAVGAIYARPCQPGEHEGAWPGTLSTAVLRWNHERSADVIVSPAWTDHPGPHGFSGTTTFPGRHATHGSDSPFDLHIPLMAAGPDIKAGFRSHVPTGNIDLAPTLLFLAGIKPPESMDGRVLHEWIVGGPEPETVPVEAEVFRTERHYPDGFRYAAELHTLRVGTTTYLREAHTQRTPPSP